MIRLFSLPCRVNLELDAVISALGTKPDIPTRRMRVPLICRYCETALD